MSIETTLNIKRDYLNRLSTSCKNHTLSRSGLIALLLRRFLRKQKLPYSMFKTISYQKRNQKKNWKIIHVSYPVDLFEKCCDVRKFSKISVSFLVSMAIDSYLDVVEEELSGAKGTNEKITDNYELSYTCIANNEYDNMNFHTYWMLPETKAVEKYLQKLQE
jgi:hypothetical protein